MTDHDKQRDDRTGRSAAAARMAHQHTWVDQQIRIAMEKGQFDDLPGAGKPIKDLGASHDPDWWLKKLVERERIAVLPPSLQLRKDDAELDDRLDELFAEAEVRREVEDFNARVMRARYSPQDGQPPLVTMPRDVDQTVAGWHRRREVRRAARAAAAAAAAASEPSEQAGRPGRRRWWRRSRH
ncbi:DUF1992 domain-containing protein [Nocardioides lijunqiniae]|uniref:DnaJ family domain-containing protein n=1 Tax=Nocardioides lijunqiniae TaxID=2760832 RepID=UPI0018775DA9|nr:DUF1992 domain-containing protein [Nocardioides lijunqiniae]